MCDCPRDKANENNPNETAPETVTLFEKCQKTYQPGQDAVGQSVSGVNLNENSWKLVDFLERDSSDVICETPKNSSTSSGSSTESSRTYKFVTPRECKCNDGDEEERSDKLRPMTFDLCAEKEEPQREVEIECTLAIIKPEAVAYKKQIERRIFEEGFEIYQTRWLQLTPEQVSEFYSSRYGQLDFPHLVAYMASGPIIVHVLAKCHAIKDWRMLMGPTKVTEARLYFPDSIRARYGRRGEDFKNAVHGSNNRKDAEREIHFFFPELIIEPLLHAEVATDYLWETINPILVDALSLCCKLKPADPILWLANWLILNNPNKPKLPEDIALIPT